MPGNGGGANIERQPERARVLARPQRNHHRPVGILMHRRSHLPRPGPQHRLHLPQHRRVHPQAGNGQRRQQAVRIAQRHRHIRRRHPHAVQGNCAIHRNPPRLRPLAHHLAVGGKLARHVDHQIPGNPRRARQPTRAVQPPRAPAGLGLPRRRQMRFSGGNAVLGKHPRRHLNLAAPAQPAPAANRFDVNPQRPRRIQQRRAQREPAAPPAGHKQHQRVAHAGACPPFSTSTSSAAAS